MKGGGGITADQWEQAKDFDRIPWRWLRLGTGGRVVAAERHNLGETEPDAGECDGPADQSYEMAPFLLTGRAAPTMMQRR